MSILIEYSMNEHEIIEDEDWPPTLFIMKYWIINGNNSWIDELVKPVLHSGIVTWHQGGCFACECYYWSYFIKLS